MTAISLNLQKMKLFWKEIWILFAKMHDFFLNMLIFFVSNCVFLNYWCKCMYNWYKITFLVKFHFLWRITFSNSEYIWAVEFIEIAKNCEPCEWRKWRKAETPILCKKNWKYSLYFAWICNAARNLRALMALIKHRLTWWRKSVGDDDQQF